MNIIWKELKQTFIDVFRNGLLSVASIISMTMALLSIATVLVLNIATEHAKETVFSKLDMAVEIKQDAEMPLVESLVNEIKSNDSVIAGGVTYTSKEKAFKDFKEHYEDRPELLGFMDELDNNPLYSSLVVRTNNPKDHAVIKDMIMQAKYKPVVKEIKESASKDKAIERITELVSILNRIGITVSFLFVIVAVASVYNTIRLTIYTRRQEVDIMKLVGASYSTIRRPFVREGIFYGILGAVITLFLIFPLSSFAAPGLLSYLNTSPSETLLFLMRSIPTLVLIEFIAGIGMGTISSLMATYAYLGSNKA